VVAQIRNHVGVPWRAETVDRILAGDPDTVVKGIAVTMMATLDVIERAVAAARTWSLPTTHLLCSPGHNQRTSGRSHPQVQLDFIARTTSPFSVFTITGTLIIRMALLLA